MQKKIATYMQNKSQGIQDYKIMLNMLDKYEELNLATYVDNDESKWGTKWSGYDVISCPSVLTKYRIVPYKNEDQVKGFVFLTL